MSNDKKTTNYVRLADWAKCVQAPPIPSSRKPVAEWFLNDLACPLKSNPRLYTVLSSRVQFGFDKYGVLLRPSNGRDALIDELQENLDAYIYCYQKIAETCEFDMYQLHKSLGGCEPLAERMVLRLGRYEKNISDILLDLEKEDEARKELDGSSEI